MKPRVIASGLLIVHAVAFVSCVAARARPPVESVTARVDKLFAEWDRADSPGCSFAVSKNGVAVYQRGYGMANLELNVPITPASVFHVASIAKQFTAMSILLLAQRGQLSLDDEVRKHVPEWVDSRSGLKIRHLLTHTGGLRDVFLLHELAARQNEPADFDNDAIARMLARQRALNFAPSSEFQYNNGGYALLANIVKRVSGQSLRTFTDSNIFKPLGMTHTHFHDDPTMITPNRASGYHRDKSGLHVALHPYYNRIVGNSGLFTTAPDLLLWEQNFAAPRVGDAALVAAMQAPAFATGWSDEEKFYGFGLEIGEHRGLRTISHGGFDPGYTAYVIRYPDRWLAVALLCNLDDKIPVGALTRSVAELYLGDVGVTPSKNRATPPPPGISLSAEQMASKVGLYRNVVNGRFDRIIVRDGKLMFSTLSGEAWELTPVGVNRVVILGTSVVAEFVAPVAGRPQEIHVTGDGPNPWVAQQVTTSFAPSNTELRAFAGAYGCPDLDVTYTITAQDSALVLQIPGRSGIVLEPAAPDTFVGPLVEVVKFSRDARGAVTAFTVSAGGVRSLRFDRVKQ